MKMNIDGFKTEKVTIEVDSVHVINDLYRIWKNSVVLEGCYVRDGVWTKDDSYRFMRPYRKVSEDEQKILEAFDLIRETMKSIES